MLIENEFETDIRYIFKYIHIKLQAQLQSNLQRATDMCDIAICGHNETT